ncbi:MAG: replication-associated recombination protein A [Bacilli bacterium]
MNEPLAVKLRPSKLSDVVGQSHLIGKDQVLYNLVKNKRLVSMILYGKPGIGKNSIAYALINELGFKYRELNATINNKKDFDIVVEEARMYKGLVVIMDEIHRLNKDKQDLLLPHVESGLITLIGLTTSNPYHSINPAIRSRCQIFELKELDDKDLLKGLRRAIKSAYLGGIKISNKELSHIIKLSGGDLRFAYNLLEVAYLTSIDKKITMDILKKINNKPAFFHDKNEDGYYDVLSAFQKSIRGSDVNAALHYLGRLLLAGDFDSIFRRLSVIVYEDIGLANPSMGPKVMAAIEASERLGMPEMCIPLGVVIIELCLSPKSNTGKLAIHSAILDIEQGNVGSVPRNLKNAPDSTYKYPHDFPNAFVKQQYLPDKIKDREYYKAKNTSKYEKQLLEIYNKLKKMFN